MTQRWTMNRLWAAWWAAALVLGLGAEATAQGLTYEGVLTDLDNQPINETLAMSFSLFPQEDGGEALWTEAQEVEVSDGTFTVILGKVEPLPEDPPAGLFLELTIDEDVQSPRTPVAGTLYAVRAQVADDVPGRDITPRTVSIDGVGPVIDEEGRWVGAVNTTDSDNDGFLDVVEMAVGTDPEDAQSVPEDLDEDGVPDQLKGAVGPAGPQGEQGEAGPEGPPGINGLDSNPGAVADELLINNQFLLQIAQLMVDNHQEQLRGAPGADADPEAVAAALALDDAFRAALAEYLVNNFADDLRGPPGEPGNNSETPNIVGNVVPGTTFNSLDTPAVIPDNNEFGFSSTLFVNEDITIERLSIDISISHPEMGDVRIILHSPAGTQVTLYDGEDTGTADLETNFGRLRRSANNTRLYEYVDQSTQGQWRLQVTDQTEGSQGTLNSWQINVNEGWDNGTLLVGEAVEVDSKVIANDGIEVRLGSDLVMYNRAGEETFRIDGENGPPLGLLIKNSQGRIIGRLVNAMYVDSIYYSAFVIQSEDLIFQLRQNRNSKEELLTGNNYNDTFSFEGSNCTGVGGPSSTSKTLTGEIPYIIGNKLQKINKNQTVTIFARSILRASTCSALTTPGERSVHPLITIADEEELNQRGLLANPFTISFGNARGSD